MTVMAQRRNTRLHDVGATELLVEQRPLCERCTVTAEGLVTLDTEHRVSRRGGEHTPKMAPASAPLQNRFLRRTDGIGKGLNLRQLATGDVTQAV